jgi:hypothetical protein
MVCGTQHTVFVFYPVGAGAAHCGEHETRRACTCGPRKVIQNFNKRIITFTSRHMLSVCYVRFTYCFCLHSLSHILSLLHFYFVSRPYVVNDRVARCDCLLSAVILGIDDGKYNDRGQWERQCETCQCGLVYVLQSYCLRKLSDKR